ncbi:hypothetical protein B0A52_08582 [Exophiala mesophila]|uniref:Transcription factor domain-containing protein n=1 Tax=Exophiala mesophila TaxID=212818 RepID=A0A438MW55_EXOME|nr:hypothetical protein B0A52_08582 [Exophiala mesophila]
MDSLGEPSFHFVAFKEPRGKGRTRGGNSLSEARSHAARVSHKQRKQARQENANRDLVWVNQTTNSKSVTGSSTLLTTRTKVPPSPWSLLPQHKSDPFGSHQMEVLPKYLIDCLEYAYEHVHPTLILGATSSHRAMITTSWRRLGLEWPLMYHLQVASAANIVRASGKTTPLPTHMEISILNHQSEGLLLIQDELQTLKGAPSDALLMAMVMAGMLANPVTSQMPETFRLSPLATASKMHIYGKLDVVPETHHVLVDMVNRRGGILTVKTYGMRSILQIADLQFATRFGVVPSFPWVYESLLFTREHEKLKSSTGFDQCFQYTSIDPDLSLALRSAAEVTILLEKHRTHPENATRLADLVFAADEVHHRLMSIEEFRFLDTDPTSVLQDICRWAALIYSDLVLFPLPAATKIKPRLAGKLKDAIKRLETVATTSNLAQSTLLSPDVSNVLLWALMLGGFASIFSPHSAWYTRTLARYLNLQFQLSKSSREPDWQDFKAIMSSFLWWDFIFEEPGARLWWEARLSYSPENSSGLSSGSDVLSTLSSSDAGWSPLTWPSQSLSP